MSNFRAIATVTATIQRTLQEAVQADVAGATVSTVRPSEGDNTNLPTTGVNLFLYQVGPNPSWRNADLPTRRNGGELAQRPQAALDLHYLFSFYGGEPALEPQRLLGSTVAFLHSQPLITRAQIEAAVADTSKPFLANSDLADQIDLVRFTPLSLSLEEISRLWSIFFQVKYVLSVAYQASIVLIAPQVTPRPALPTRTFDLTALPIRRPFVARVVAQAGEDAPIVPGSTVIVEGQSLREEVMRVEIDGAEVAVGDARPERLILTLPGGLTAGAHSLQVRHGVQFGAPGVSHLVFPSNAASFVLRPVITETAGQPDIAISNVQGTGTQPRSADVAVGVDPVVGAEQLVTLELLTGEGVAHTFMGQPPAVDTDPVAFAISGVVAGDYLFRVRVDGAESPLEVDAAGVPVGPEATIP
jgi:Pvc16 N-terminal domain